MTASTDPADARPGGRDLATVRIHPGFAGDYQSPVLTELLGRAGRRGLRFTTDGFPATPHGRDLLLARVRVAPDGTELRLAFSMDDQAALRPGVVDWCDAIGKVNVTPEDAAAEPKIVPLGPLFGIRYADPRAMARLVTASTLRALGHVAEFSSRRHLAWFRRAQHSRPALAEIVPGASRSDYVCSIARAWNDHHAWVNAPRATFMRTCRAIEGLRFEGGFVDGADDVELADLALDGWVPRQDYYRRLRESTLVFNTPAVHGCLGWKLGEFLGMGKAIISLPIRRALPAPLVHGEHLHVVPHDDPDVLRSAIERIVGDHDYRRRLETAARAYYEQHVTPTGCVDRVLLRAEQLTARTATPTG